jgi:peptidyl-prolyl cis-trans isomerase D
MSFDQAKAKLRADLAHDEAVDRLYTIANHVDDALAGGADIGDAAAKFGLKSTVVAAVDEQGRDPEGKPAALPVSPAEVLKLAFATDEKRTSRVTETADGAVFVLRMDKVVPPAVRPLAAVKDKAIAAWQAEQRRDRVATAAEALKAAIEPGTDLATVATAKGLKATTSPPLTRQSEGSEGVPPALVAKLFALQPGGVAAAADETGSYVAQLKQVQQPKTGAKTATAELSRAVDAGVQADLGDAFAQALRARFPVQIQRETLDRLF